MQGFRGAKVILFEFTPNGAVTGTATRIHFNGVLLPEVTSTAMRTFFFTPSMQGNNLFAFILLIWRLNTLWGMNCRSMTSSP